MQLFDRLTIGKPRRTSDGFFAVRARSARAGVYDYLGREIDPAGERFKPDEIVKVYRPADEVFDAASLGSFVGKPVTDDHPSEPVTAANWRDYARGAVMGAVRDGDFVGFDLAFMDASAIAKIDDGKRELSNGYACDLAFEDGEAPDGTPYQAVQRNIRGNHVALVERGRAGSECRVADERFAACDAIKAELLGDYMGEKPMKKTVKIDGVPVDLSDAETVGALIETMDADKKAAEKALADAQAEHDRELAARDAEIDKLKAAALDQAAIDALADEKADTIDKGRAILGDDMPETAGKSAAEIRRAVVAAKIGDDAIEGKSDDYIAARFDALDASDTAAAPFTAPAVTNDSGVDIDAIRAKRRKALSDAHRAPIEA